MYLNFGCLINIIYMKCFHIVIILVNIIFKIYIIDLLNYNLLIKDYNIIIDYNKFIIDYNKIY